MRREYIKSVILTTLVIVSLVLSYSLWSYQPTYDVLQNQDYVQKVSIGAKRDFKDIVIPNLLVVHESNKNYETTKQSNISPIYRSLQKSEITNFENLTNKTSEVAYQSITKGKNKLEIIFPTVVPVETLGKVLNLDAKRLQNVLFDRIIINLSSKQDSSARIYFSNEAQKILYGATFDNSSIIASVDKIRDNYESFTESLRYKLDSGKIIYLPKKPIKLTTMEFLTTDIDVDKLKDAIFSDPSNVRKESTDSGDTFTDGTRLMSVSPLNRSISFVNPTTPENNNNQSPNLLVQRSVDFINAHGGWTDGYILSGVKPENNEVSFRLFVNNLPVYNNSTITTSWGVDDIETFKRPLYKFRIQVDKKESEMELMAGPQIMEIISNNKSINKSLIKDISLGYETIFDEDKSTINQPYYNRAIQLKPVWIINYDDTYKKIDQDLLSRTGVNIVGLE
ncbi:YycH family regulatory protein [Gottfriedia acidiceleris]|uniref:Two-component system activity regulator YycH n=1 Tax=Gottfriedia acidiceleris TaxID=371036 RepID=A0ABY4JNR3_9BACI|nr:two-component system activity regulator YycH [Gottfriedia acidiceleris]UPM54347.1 two-component system activity regulator YycH [Gottfriedia acidiceleris]